jgi:hypothetical protein
MQNEENPKDGDLDLSEDVLKILAAHCKPSGPRPLNFQRKMFFTEDEYQAFMSGLKETSDEKEKQRAFVLQRLTPAQNIIFKGRKFMFTESFLFGSRKKCGAAVEARGGIWVSTKRPTMDLDYLVLGEKDCEWKNGVFFGKIERALDLIEQGNRMRFIREADFVAALG